MEYLRPIIDCQSPKKIVLAGRQVGKTQMCGAEACAETAAQRDFCVLYGTVDNNKLRNFTNQKIDPIINNSPIFREMMLKGNTIKDNVTDKRFSNGSMLMIRNAKIEQNLRSPSTDSMKLDEIQDMLCDNIYIGVKSMFTSPHKLVALYGTPKSYQNIIQGYFNLSSQSEWLIPCHSCSVTISGPNRTLPTAYWNAIGPLNMRRSGLVCSRCGRPINPKDGHWVKMYEGMEYEGFRVPEPISPFADFDDLMNEMENPMIPYGQKMNEIFGLSWETSDRWITESELKDVCTTTLKDKEPLRFYDTFEALPLYMKQMISNNFVVAGVDWSLNLEGGAETVVFIGVVGTYHELLPLFGMKIPKNLTWDEQVEYIGDKLLEFNINVFCGDVGAAGNRNVQIAEKIGKDKVIQIEWGTGKTIREKYRQDVRVLNINRTMAFSDLKTDLLTIRDIRLPIWKDFGGFAEDFLVVSIEEDKLGRLKYDHPPGTHDDATHALIYMNIARKIALGSGIHHLVVTAEENV